MATIQCDTDTKSTSINMHPCNEEMLPRWQVIEDTIQDEYQIKSKDSTYLPVPSGIEAQTNTDKKNAMYNAYKSRAVYYRYLADTIGGMMGLVTRKETQFELPTKIEPMKESIGYDGDSLNTVMNRTLENQLSYSRYGILLEIRDGSIGTDVLPFMTEYIADKIVNWEFDKINGKKQLVALILDESYYKIDTGMNRTLVEEYRICALDYVDKETPIYYTYTATPAEVNAFDVGQKIPDNATTPNIMNKMLDFIPFQPFNALSLEMETEIPILMQLADMSLAIYRGEADYRSSLYMHGQATPYGTGVNRDNDQVGLGSGTFIEVQEKDAKLGFLEIAGNGVDAQKAGLDGLHSKCSEVGITLINGNSQESGEALNIRVGIKTASLAGVVKINAKGFENLLKWSAKWVGVNPDDVSITPNLDFSDERPAMKEILEFATLVQQGQARAEDLYNLMKKFELTTSLDFETWIDEIQSSPLTIQQFVIDEASEVGNEQE